VTVEVLDASGNRVPNAERTIRFQVTGAGELAAQASSSPNDATSFREPLRKTYEGRCITILRPQGAPGKITLRAETDGLPASSISVRTLEAKEK
jgi:beta-galactosidase